MYGYKEYDSRHSGGNEMNDELIGFDIGELDDILLSCGVLIDTEKWEACKFYPKMYGEKQAVEVTGKDGAPLAPPVINILPVKTKDE